MRLGIFMIFWMVFPFLYSQTVVDNGNAPGKYEINFVEDLRFGMDEDRDEFIWPDPATKVIPSSKGYMYIVDPQENRIMEFNPNGEYVRMVAAPGQGPGELIGIKGFTILADGTAIAVDGPIFADQKLILFDSKLKFVKEFRQPTVKFVPQTSLFAPDGKHFFTMMINRGGESGKVILQNCILRTDDFQVKVNVSQAIRPLGDDDFAKTWRDFIVWQLQMNFGGFGVASFDTDGHLYTAMSNRYEITKWRPNLQGKALVIKRDHKPVVRSEEHVTALVDFFCEGLSFSNAMRELFTPAFKKDILKRADAGPVKNPIFGLIGMEDGRLMVIHDVDYVTRKNVADIFSAEGVYLGQTLFNDSALLGQEDNFETRMTFKNGFAYSAITDEDGDNRAVRYRYQLKPVARGKASE